MSHRPAIDTFLQSFLDCLHAASLTTLPVFRSRKKRKLPGWNGSARFLKLQANFWYHVWSEAGSPVSRVLSMIKRKAKSRYKYEVRRLRRQEKFICHKKLTVAFTSRNKSNFWKEVKKVRGGKHSFSYHGIDGSVDASDISQIFKNKLASTLNKHNDCSFKPSFNLSAEEIGACQISSDVVLQAFDRLKARKKDHSSLESFSSRCPCVADSLSVNFYSVTAPWVSPWPID